MELEDFFRSPGLNHILVQVFSSLPPLDLGVCRAVSGEWRDFINREVFNNARVMTRRKKKFSLYFDDLSDRLIEAAKNGDVDVLDKVLITPEVDLNRVGKNGDTALVVASFLGHASVVVRLLAAAPDSIDVNCADGAGKLALISACSNTASDNSAVVGALVARPDVDVNATDREQSTALMQAAYTGNSAAVKELIARPDLNVNQCSPYLGKTALILASEYGRAEAVRILLTRPDVDVNICASLGWNALNLASSRGHDAVVEALLQRPEIEVNGGGVGVGGGVRNSLAVAAGEGYFRVVQLLLSRSDIAPNGVQEIPSNSIPLLCATAAGHDAVARLLADRDDVDVNRRNLRGNTALMLAAKEGRTRIMESLLRRGDIDVNATNEDHWTALIFATKHWRLAAAKMLMQKNDLDLNVRDDLTGSTALEIAEAENNEEMVNTIERRMAQDKN